MKEAAGGELLVTRERSHAFRPNLLLRDLAALARKAASYPCNVAVRQGMRRVNGKSFVEMSGLSLGGNATILFEAWGVDARECLASLCRITARAVALHEENQRLQGTLFLGPGEAILNLEEA